MLCLIVRKYREQDWQGLAEALEDADLSITSVGVSVQPKKNNVIMGNGYITLRGEPFITDKIGDVSFRISPLSFYQVNPAQMKVLYDLAGECAGLTGRETVWDLYCGIGTIGLYLAGKAGHVIGIETVPEAISNAKENAEINGIQNAEYHGGKAEVVFSKLAAGKDGADQVVIVDPPRKGCDEKLLQAITEFAPGRIVYVSCDPATLARDLKILCENGYQLKRVIPVDQFCHSVHCEVVVSMSRVGSKR